MTTPAPELRSPGVKCLNRVRGSRTPTSLRLLAKPSSRGKGESNVILDAHVPNKATLLHAHRAP